MIDLHTVLEHHDVMTPRALDVFVREYGWSFPIGIDKPSGDDNVPQTTAAYGMRGTPSLLLFDHRGALRSHGFGRADDMLVRAKIMALVAEHDGAAKRPTGDRTDRSQNGENEGECNKGSCAL